MTFGRRAIVAATSAMVGCTMLTSLDGLSGGAPAAPDDGGTRADGADGSAPEPPADGGEDADDGAPVSGPFCDHVDATFCEAWDRLVDLGRWTVFAGERAAQGVDDAAATSPPSSFWMTTETLAADEVAQSHRSVRFGSAVRSLAFEVNVRVEQRSQSRLVIGGVGLEGRGDDFRYSAYIVLEADRDAIEEAKEGATDSYRSYGTPAMLRGGVWTRVRVVLSDRGAGPYRLEMSYDGVPVLDRDLELWTSGDPGTPFIRVGPGYLRGPSAPWAVRLDDLTFDAR